MLGIAGTAYSKKSKGIRFYANEHDVKNTREKWPEYSDWQIEKIKVLQGEMVRLEQKFEAAASV